MKSLPTLYQSFIHLSRYSRWLEAEGRRESWEETVDRYFRFFDEHFSEKGVKLNKTIRDELREAVLNLEKIKETDYIGGSAAICNNVSDFTKKNELISFVGLKDNKLKFIGVSLYIYI